MVPKVMKGRHFCLSSRMRPVQAFTGVAAADPASESRVW
jgi:hypothetical protein